VHASTKAPKQAVILAGGLGTRLGEISKRVPKPLVPAGGVPFLAYLLRMLERQGIERVLLLLGYKADTIKEWCGDGSRFGLRIDYSIGATEDGTGRRLVRARDQLDPTFLLLYCDNYWPISLERMWQSFASKPRAVAQVTVYRNRDGFTRNNMRIGSDGFVEVYDKLERHSDLLGIDIGFVIAKRSVVDVLSDRVDSSFEVEAYTALAEQGRLAAFETDHRYYGVGNPRRLEEASRFLTRRPCVLLDRDGVLNVKAPKGRYVTSASDFRWLPGARESLRELRDAGADVVVVTNQAGIGRGVFAEEALKEIHGRMRDEAIAAGGHLLDVLHCPHDWERPCECRKPAPGMFLQAQRVHELDLSLTPFVGDDARDQEAAHALGLPFFRVDFDHGLRQAMPSLMEFLRRSGQGQKPTG